MSKKTSKPARPAKDYPLVTHGSEVAARGRRKANKMTDVRREEYFWRGMVLIYGGQPLEARPLGRAESVPSKANRCLRRDAGRHVLFRF